MFTEKMYKHRKFKSIMKINFEENKREETVRIIKEMEENFEKGIFKITAIGLAFDSICEEVERELNKKGYKVIIRPDIISAEFIER